MHHGDFPKLEIDHINRDRTDNRIENLREATRLQQMQNITLEPNPKTGYPGIYLDECTEGLKAKYTFHSRGKVYRFRTLEEAIKEKEYVRQVNLGSAGAESTKE